MVCLVLSDGVQLEIALLTAVLVKAPESDIFNDFISLLF